MRLRNTGARAFSVSAVVLLSSPVFTSAVAGASTPLPLGPSFPLTQSEDWSPQDPQVACDPDGNCMVIWEDGAVTRGRRFYATRQPAGPPFDVSLEDHYVQVDGYDDSAQSIAADAGGNFVVVYEAASDACWDDDCLFSRRFGTDFSESPVFVAYDPNLAPFPQQALNPEIAAGGDGKFVIAWEGLDTLFGTGDDEGIWARRLVPSGQAAGSGFLVNTQTDLYQGDEGDLDVAADAEGRFFVVWYDEKAYGETTLRRYSKTAQPLSDEIHVSSEQATGYRNQIAAAPDGTLFVAWHGYGVSGRIVDPDGNLVGTDFAIGQGEDQEVVATNDGFTVAWEDDQTIVGKVFDQTGIASTAEFPIQDGLPYSYGWKPAIGADANGNLLVAWDSSSGPRARFFEVSPPEPQALPVLGKVLVVTNKNPDDPEKNRAKWKAGGDNVVAPGRGTLSDPRCLADPEGTVKATVRFWSDSSGHDSGVLPLPCQHWVATGTDKATGTEKRGFRYADPKHLSGPCHSVKLRGTKSVQVSCRGRPGIVSFPYDLEPGVGEGPIHVLLELGLHRYCSTSVPFGLDGRNGTKFRGRSLPPIPASCPTGALGQCGDGIVGLDEVCDDGNADWGDLCSGNCRFITSVCGNGVVELDEICDDGNADDGDYCRHDCALVTAVCGDGVIELGEVCDDGNTDDGDYCRSDCRRVTAVCGDGSIGPGEACDDGNTDDGDYCRSDCRAVTAVCGDGAIGPGEACDDGNTQDGDLCSGDCSAETPICGDGIVGGDEACDDGNAQDGDLCNADCSAETPICGDGITTGSEVCDDGNAQDGDLCAADCTAHTPICGDGTLTVGEACDDGNTNDGDYCNATCTAATAICGDGVVGPQETCDDGNTVDGDYCTADCSTVTTVCGDGTRAGNEICDDGNLVGGDLCSPDCMTETAVCGDGLLGPGEACDDGNTVGGDLCSGNCETYAPICGDGIISPLECCDDGNDVGGDGCEAGCASGSSCPAPSAPISGSARSWRSSDGWHRFRALVGRALPFERTRARYDFDLTGVTERIVGATLRVTVTNFASLVGALPVSLWDARTPLVGTPLQRYADVGEGVRYGGYTLTEAVEGSVIEIPLNGAGVSRLEEARGGSIGIGVAPDHEYGGAILSEEPSFTQELVLTTIPE